MHDMNNRMSDITPASRAGGDTGEKTASGQMNGRSHRHYGHGLWRWTIALLAAFAAVQLLSALNIIPSRTFPEVNPNNWQAVFLVNENIPLFGHLTELNKDYVRLTDVYYTQVSQQATSSKELPQISLVKFGNEIYGPSDAMNIPKSQILHWEEMKSDSTVVKSIEEYIAAALKASEHK